MSIRIQAAGVLKERIPPDLTVEAESVGEALSQLELGDAGEVIFLVNGRMAHWQTKLQKGDVLKLVPAIGGGAAHWRRSKINQKLASQTKLTGGKPAGGAHP